MKNKPESANTKHSPLPKLESLGYVESCRIMGFTAIGTPDDCYGYISYKSRAKSIVLCVNLMPEMVEALKGAKSALEICKRNVPLIAYKIEDARDIRKACKLLDSILKKATV